MAQLLLDVTVLTDTFCQSVGPWREPGPLFFIS